MQGGPETHICEDLLFPFHQNVTDMERTSPDSHYLEIQKTVDLLRKQHPELRPSWWKEWKDGDESGRSDKI